MIPILFEANEKTKGAKAFKSNGLGGLGDAVSCIVYEERNGAYELEMTYPVDGIHYSDIKNDRLILAKPNDTSKNQIFKIYEIERPMNDLITVHAEHISYLLSGVNVIPFTESSALSTFMKFENGELIDWNKSSTNFPNNPFTFETDNEGVGTISTDVPTSVRSMLAGSEGSILDAVGGEYEFDNFRVILHKNRGYDNNVSIRYGKNLTDLVDNDSIENVYTGILPYWKGSLSVTRDNVNSEGDVVTDRVETIIYLTTTSQNVYKNENTGCTNRLVGKTLWGEKVTDYAFPISKVVDLSGIELDDYEEPEYEDDTASSVIISGRKAAEKEYKEYVLTRLTEEANRYLENNKGWKPLQTLKVSFVQLWNTEDYKDVAILERVKLCDIVYVYYPEFDISVSVKVIKTTYDVLSEKYSSIELGDPAKTASSSLVKEISDVNAAIQENNERINGVINDAIADERVNIDSDLKKAIKYATDLISGGLGGYLVINKNSAGQPNELLIMEKPDKNDPQNLNVWRFNYNGLGHSHSGYNGPFDDVALTMDGKINASMITTGYLSATRIRAGILQDSQKWNYWDLDTGDFKMTVGKAKIGSNNNYSDVASESYVTSSITSSITNYDSSLSQSKIFNLLTNNGALKGIFMQNNNLYISASYIQTGTLKLGGKNNGYGSLEILNDSGQQIGSWNNNGINILGGAFKSSTGLNRVEIDSTTGTVCGYYKGVLSSVIDVIRANKENTLDDTFYPTYGCIIGTDGPLIIRSKSIFVEDRTVSNTPALLSDRKYAAYQAAGNGGEYITSISGFDLNWADNGQGGWVAVVQGLYYNQQSYLYVNGLRVDDYKTGAWDWRSMHTNSSNSTSVVETYGVNTGDTEPPYFNR